MLIPSRQRFRYRVKNDVTCFRASAHAAILFRFTICAENVDNSASIDCASPMSARNAVKTGKLAASAGTGGRTGLAAALARGQLAGLTGTIQFDQDHRRADPGVLYTVVEESAGAFAIRVAK